MEVFLISDVGFLAQQGSMQALGRRLGRGFGLVFLPARSSSPCSF